MPRFPIVAALIALLSGALTIVLWSIELRWAALLLLVWIAVMGLALFRQLSVGIEKLFLYTFVLAYSIRMDVHIVHVPDAHGFPISLGDFWWLSLMVLWAFRRLRDPRPVGWPPRFAVPCALLLLGGIIAVFPTRDWATKFRMNLSIVQSALIFFYLWHVRLTAQDYRRLAVGVAATLVLQGVIGGLQGVTRSSLGLEFFGASNATINTNSMTSFSRVGGTIGQPNRFAIFVNGLIFVPMAMVLAARSARAKAAYVVVFLLAFGALILSQSRGGWLGFALASIPFLYLALRERLGRLHAATTLAWVYGAAVAFVLLFPPTYERLMAEDKSSAYSRIPMARTAIEMIKDNPFGVGFGEYVHRMNAYDVTQDGLSYRFRFPVHNGFLLLAAEQGVWVLLAYLALLVAFYAMVFRLIAQAPGFPRMVGIAFAAGMFAMHLQIQVEITHVVVAYYEWFVMGMAVNVLLFLQRQQAAAGTAPVPESGVTRGRSRAARALLADGDRRLAAAAPPAAAGRSGRPGTGAS